MNQRKQPYDTFLTVLGTFSILFCYVKAFPTTVFFPLLILLVVPAFFLIKHLVMVPKKNRLWIIAGIYILFCILFSSQLMTGFQYLYNQMVDTYAIHDSYVFEKYVLTDTHLILSTLCVSLLFIVYIFITTVTIYRHTLYLLDFALSVIIFIPTIMYRLPQNFLLDAFLFTYWILLWITHTIEKRGAMSCMNQKTTKKVFGMVFGCCILLQCIFPSMLYTKSKWVEDTRLSIQVFFRDLMQPRIEEKEGEIDLRNARDRVYFQTEEFKLTASRQKEYYFKTVSAGVYEDQMWKPLPEERYENYKLRWSDIIMWYPYSLTKDHKDRMEIEDYRGDNAYALIPYYVSDGVNDSDFYYDSYVKRTSDTYQYQVWDTIDMELDHMDDKRKAYAQFVSAFYKDISNDMLYLFYELDFADPNQNYTQEEATKIIKDYLFQQAVYTLSPGATPSDQDFVSYFLKENKKGYCVHFATSATLMYRYLGIPARYVEGYHVNQNQFKDGTAMVLDNNAHAWVEIFDKEKGWIPIEVTPPAQNQTTNTTTPQSPDNNPSQSQQNSQTETNPIDREPQQEEIIGNTEENSVDIHLEIVIPILLLVISTFLVVVVWKRKRQAYVQAMTQSNRKQALIAIEAYIEQWKSYGFTISKEDRAILDKAMYSQHTITEEEYIQTYTHIMQEIEQIYQKASKKLQWYIKYIKAMK